VDKSDGIRFGRTQCARRGAHKEVREQSNHAVVRFALLPGKQLIEMLRGNVRKMVARGGIELLARGFSEAITKF